MGSEDSRAWWQLLGLVLTTLPWVIALVMAARYEARHEAGK